MPDRGALTRFEAKSLTTSDLFCEAVLKLRAGAIADRHVTWDFRTGAPGDQQPPGHREAVEGRLRSGLGSPTDELVAS